MEHLSVVKTEPLSESSAKKKKLGIDELTIIFAYYWISANDLLNFRLVNKVWRDSATTILLKRDAYYVDLQLIITSAFRDDEVPSYFFKFNCYNKNQHTNITLRELTMLMSNSKQFPASNFKIRTHPDKSVFSDYSHFEDLTLFFGLHGEKIKTISHEGCVTKKLVRDICYDFAPLLECLDLSQALAINMPLNQVVGPGNIFPFKCLIIRNHATSEKNEYLHFINFLLSYTSRLCCIADVPLNTLSDILDEGKGDLIRSLDFRHITTEEVNGDFAVLVERFLGVSAILCKVTLDVSNFPWSEISLAPVNMLVSSCQHTLREFRLYFCRSVGVGKLKIPPMENLRTITLRAKLLNVPEPDEPFNLFAFNHGIVGRNYFPRLKHVILQTRGVRIDNLASLVLLEQRENIFPKVDVLEIFTMPVSFKLNLTIFSKIFPHVRSLTLNLDQNIEILSSSLWMLRSLEFIEIYEIGTRGETSADFDLALFVDQFFTGFSSRLCQKLNVKILPRNLNTPDQWKFLQRKESICNLKDLKQLKLKFSPTFSVPFASSVTRLYALAKMQDTKFIISYDPDAINNIIGGQQEDCNGDERERYEKLCFGSIQQYVNVIQEVYRL